MSQDADRLAFNALDAMIHVLDLKSSDRVVVVTDQETAECGDAFVRGARSHGCRVQVYELPATGRPLQAMPEDMTELLEETTVVINAIPGDAREIPFRLEWIHAIEATKRIRMGHSPGIDLDMMLHGPMNVDYAQMKRNAARLLTAFEDAEFIDISTVLGTKLRLDVRGRPFIHDLKATIEAGANLPCGEIYCAPVESGADGTLIIDGPFGSNGPVAALVGLRITEGEVRDIICRDPGTLKTVTELMDTDSGSRTIAELGIGLNPGARLTPRMLEAEKADRTAHIAFGDNEGIAGGQNRSSTHIDYLFTEPTIEVEIEGGERRQIMRRGEPVIE